MTNHPAAQVVDIITIGLFPTYESFRQLFALNHLKTGLLFDKRHCSSRKKLIKIFGFSLNP